MFADQKPRESVGAEIHTPQCGRDSCGATYVTDSLEGNRTDRERGAVTAPWSGIVRTLIVSLAAQAGVFCTRLDDGVGCPRCGKEGS